MDQLGRTFRKHVLATAIDGCTITQEDDSHISLATAVATGAVVFYAFDNAPEIVELRIADKDRPDEPSFFLHFELTDEARAETLFAQMTEALTEQDSYDTTRVLLCCTAGMTTSLFANKLTEVATTLGLDYIFEAIPLEQAREQAGVAATAAGAAGAGARDGAAGTGIGARATPAAPAWDAVLLAPQVGYQRKSVQAAFPDAVVVEIPTKLFATFDAAGVLRILMHLLSDHTVFPQPDAKDLRFARGTKNDKRVMCITCIHRTRSTWMGWRIYGKGTVLGYGKSVKPQVDMHDIEDLIATLPAQGFQVEELDAIGIALPGIVRHGRVSNPALSAQHYDLAHVLCDRYGVKVFVENNARAAAVGCYVSQNEFDSVVLHTQQTGFPVGGQGIVVDGHLCKGNGNFSGEIGPLTATQLGFVEERDPESFWTPEGMRASVARNLVADISLIAPDAIYVAVDLVDDMDQLRADIARYLAGIEDYIPQLIKVDNYRERIALGMLALCLQFLHTPRPHRKH